MKHGRGIAFLDGVEDRPIPDIDAVLETDIGDDQDHKADGKHPRQPVAASAPKSLGADPESRQQIILAGLLGFFRRQFWVGFEEFGRRRLDLVAGFGDDFDERGFFAGRFGFAAGFDMPGNAKEIRRFRAIPSWEEFAASRCDQSGSMN